MINATIVRFRRQDVIAYLVRLGYQAKSTLMDYNDLCEVLLSHTDQQLMGSTKMSSYNADDLAPATLATFERRLLRKIQQTVPHGRNGLARIVWALIYG